MKPRSSASGGGLAGGKYSVSNSTRTSSVNKKPTTTTSTQQQQQSTSGNSSTIGSRRSSFLRDKIQDAQQQAVSLSTSTSSTPLPTTKQQQQQQQNSTNHSSALDKENQLKLSSDLPVDQQQQSSQKSNNSNTIAAFTTSTKDSFKQEGKKVEEKQEVLADVIQKIIKDQHHQHQQHQGKEVDDHENNNKNNHYHHHQDAFRYAATISESLMQCASATGKKAATTATTSSSLSKTQSPSSPNSKNDIVSNNNNNDSKLESISQLLKSHRVVADDENKNKQEEENDSPFLVFDAILSENQQQQSITNKKPPAKQSTKKPSSLPPPSKSSSTVSSNQQNHRPSWKVSSTTSLSSSMETPLKISGSKLQLPKQKKSIDAEFNSNVVVDDAAESSSGDDQQLLVVTSCSNCHQLSKLSLDSKELKLPATTADTKNNDLTLCSICLRDKNNNNKNKNKTKEQEQEDDDDEPLNEWQLKAKRAAENPSDAAFELQKNGWSCAQISGRTCPLSVTCLVKKKNDASGIELRHVGGATTSSVVSSSTSSEAPSTATTIRTLTCSAIPNFQIVVAAAATSADDDDDCQEENNNNNYPNYLVPSSSQSSLINTTSNFIKYNNITYKGPIKFGSRHDANDDVTGSNSNTRGTLEISASSSLAPTNDLKNNNFFDHFKYSGLWKRDSFMGPGTLLASWFADRSGAGSGSVMISSSNWLTLAHVATLSSSSSSSQNNNNSQYCYYTTSIKVPKKGEDDVHDGSTSIHQRDPFALHFLRNSGSNQNSYSQLEFVCEGKMLPSQIQQQQNQQEQQQQKPSSPKTPQCLHVFRTDSSSLPTLHFLLPRNNNNNNNSKTETVDSYYLAEHLSSLKNGEVITCKEGEEDFVIINNNTDDTTQVDQATTTLGSLIAMRQKNAATPSSPTSTVDTTSPSSTTTGATPSRLLLSLANADLLQMLVARARENLKKQQNNSKSQMSLLQKTTSLEAFLLAKTWNWNLFCQILKIARDDYIEPRRFETRRLESQLETAKKKLEGVKKNCEGLEGTVSTAEDALSLMMKGQQQQHLDDEGKDENGRSEQPEELQEQIDQTLADIETAKVSVEEQNQNFLRLKDEIRKTEIRVKQLDEDVDALQKEQDHCLESKRNLSTKKTKLEEEKKKENAAYASAMKKLEEMKTELKNLQLEYFVKVIEPNARDELISSMMGGSSNDTKENSSSSLFAQSSSSSPSFIKQIEKLTSTYEKKRTESIQNVSKIKTQISQIEDEREKLEKSIKETPDESALLVAFQSAEAQSEIILSRIRSMQQMANSSNNINNNNENVSGTTSIVIDDETLEKGEAGRRSKHAATMSNFSKRLAEIRDTIRQQTDLESELVTEIDKLQKEQEQQRSNNSQKNPLRVKATAPVTDEFFVGKKKKNENTTSAETSTPNIRAEEKNKNQSTEQQQQQTPSSNKAEEAKAKRELQSLKSDMKTADAEMKELRYFLKPNTPSLLLLDSTQLASLSNDLLRQLLQEAKNENNSINNSNIDNNNNNSLPTMMKSPRGATQQQQQQSSSSNLQAFSESSSSSSSSFPWSISEALKDFDSKNKTLQLALSHCDAQIAELRQKAQRVKQLESKLEVTMDAASVAQTSAQVKLNQRMNLFLQQQQQQNSSSSQQQQPRHSFSGLPSSTTTTSYNHPFAASAKFGNNNNANKQQQPMSSMPLLPSLGKK